jgi:ribosomal protein S27E
MRVDCVSCGYEINLDHKVFDDYSGPIKCYSCGAMMEVKTTRGALCSLMPLESRALQITEEGRDAVVL